MKTETPLMRYDIINTLAEKINAKTYLEIGVQSRSNCFNKINVETKVCVDPDINSNPDWCMTSDEFFENSKDNYDIIFIDGLHYADQVYKDILNSLDHLSENGFIVCHDMNPTKYEEQLIPRQTKRWNGDCWKALVKLRAETNNLTIFTIDTDEGIGVISKNKNGLFTYLQDRRQLLSYISNLSYEDLRLNRTEFLNLITTEDFLKEYEN